MGESQKLSEQTPAGPIVQRISGGCQKTTTRSATAQQLSAQQPDYKRQWSDSFWSNGDASVSEEDVPASFVISHKAQKW